MTPARRRAVRLDYIIKFPPWVLTSFLLSLFFVMSSCRERSPTIENKHTPLFRIFENQRVGFMNIRGKIVIPPVFDMAGYFTEGLAPASQGKKWGYVDRRGVFVITPKWEGAGNFVSGVACVKLRVERVPNLPRENSWRDKEIWTLIDRQGQRIIDDEFEPCYHGRYHRETPRLIDGRLCINTTQGDYFLDADGKKVLGPYFRASPFREGLAIVHSKMGVMIIDPWGTPIPPSVNGNYGYIGEFSDGMAEIEILQNLSIVGRSYVNRNGRLAFPGRWKWVYPFSNGHAVVGDEGGETIINSSGSLVASIPKGHKMYMSRPSEGLAVISRPCFQPHCLRYMEMISGKIVIPGEFVEAGLFQNGLAWAVQVDPPRAGYIDRSGKYIWISKTGGNLSSQVVDRGWRIESELFYPQN